MASVIAFPAAAQLKNGIVTARCAGFDEGMFGESTVGNIVGVGILVLFGAYVHYRVTTRRKQTQLAVCLLEEDDTLLVDELERLVARGDLQPIKDTYASTPEPVVPEKARATRKPRKPRPAIA